MKPAIETTQEAKLPLKQRIRHLWEKMIHLNATAEQIAGGFAIGIFTCCLPILPFDTPVAMGLAWLFGRNAIAAMTATTITLVIVPVIPFLWMAAYQIGKLIVPAHHILKFNHANLSEILGMGWDVYRATLIGSMIIATPIALASYVVIKRLVTKWQSQHKPKPPA